MSQLSNNSICINEVIYGSIHFVFSNIDVLHSRNEHKETLSKFDSAVDDKIKALLKEYKGVSIDESYRTQDFGFGFLSNKQNKQNLIGFLNELKKHIEQYDFIDWYLE